MLLIFGTSQSEHYFPLGRHKVSIIRFSAYSCFVLQLGVDWFICLKFCFSKGVRYLISDV